MKRTDLSDASCAIAQALDVVGDWWTLLVVRDVAGGLHRFDSLQRETGISRKVLTERLGLLVAHGVLERRPYSEHPPRHEYHLTAKGRGLLPVLVALQDWGTRHVLGDGSLTATSAATSPEARRVQDLVGRRLDVAALPGADGNPTDPVGGTPWTVVYCFPGAEAPGGHGYPPGWGDIPGAPGCTLESTTYRDRHADFAAAGATVHGVSTQRPDQLAAFAEHAGLPFALLSDTDLALATALRLPTFRAAGVDRLKRLTLLVDRAREVRAVLFPVTDPAGSVDDALSVVSSLRPA
jgi:DNA-binding HxlR family transcriptional regulator/peroxiredoxin